MENFAPEVLNYEGRTFVRRGFHVLPDEGAGDGCVMVFYEEVIPTVWVRSMRPDWMGQGVAAQSQTREYS